jgi:anti-sigma regulatory factor (Ser/Thr protein kinase)
VPITTQSDSLVIPASLDHLSEVHEWAQQHIEALPVPQDKQYEILLSLSEAVTNAIRHGCCSKASEKITITIEKNHNVFRLTVQDSGSGFDPSKLPDPTRDDRLLQPSGRGVFLLRSLADEVRFDFSSGTSVTATFRFTA